MPHSPVDCILVWGWSPQQREGLSVVTSSSLANRVSLLLRKGCGDICIIAADWMPVGQLGHSGGSRADKRGEDRQGPQREGWVDAVELPLCPGCSDGSHADTPVGPGELWQLGGWTVSVPRRPLREGSVWPPLRPKAGTGQESWWWQQEASLAVGARADRCAAQAAGRREEEGWP